MELSIVIIVSKSHADWTEKTLQNLAGLDAELLLYDTTNNTYAESVLQKQGVRFCRGPWEGYEHVRYTAALRAKYDWILMLHAGEQLDDRLKNSLRSFDLKSRQQAYRIRFKNFFDNKWLCHGEWGGYYHIRFANRKSVSVKDQRVTEQIFAQQEVPVGRLAGHILHSSIKDRNALIKKIAEDAELKAAKYFREGRSITPVRSWFSPLVTFFQAYILKLGFLDGRHGYFCARMGAKYTSLKYARLRELRKGT